MAWQWRLEDGTPIAGATSAELAMTADLAGEVVFAEATLSAPDTQPYVVAIMTELIDPEPTDRILDVGTGSGYQAAVAAELVDEVYSVELIPELAASAAERLARLGYDNVHVRAGDGYLGWPEHAPFDAILVTAGAEHVPQPLLDQLAVGGRMVIPVGETQSEQVLRVIEKRPDGTTDSRDIAPVRFVPLTRAE